MLEMVDGIGLNQDVKDCRAYDCDAEKIKEIVFELHSGYDRT